jgi:hypothetical protein
MGSKARGKDRPLAEDLEAIRGQGSKRARDRLSPNVEDWQLCESMGTPKKIAPLS